MSNETKAPQPPAEAQPVANGVVQRHVVTKFSDGSTRVEDVLTAPSAPVGVVDVDALAQEIRRVDGEHSLGASALAEALVPYLARTTLAQQPAAVDGVRRVMHELCDCPNGRAEHAKWCAALAAQPGGKP